MYQGLKSTPPFCSATVLGAVCSRMDSCRWPLLTSTERLKTEYGSPAIVVTLPPASLTSRAPADTSQGLSLYSQKASATPAGNPGQCWRSIKYPAHCPGGTAHIVSGVATVVIALCSSSCHRPAFIGAAMLTHAMSWQ